MLFMPLSVLAGYFTQQVASFTNQLIPVRWIRVHDVLVFLLGCYLSILGAQKQIGCLNPNTILYRQEDEAAMTWIKANVPEDETIVINPTGWGYGLYMGNDGGYWISPLTGRVTIPSNALYGQNKEKRV